MTLNACVYHISEPGAPLSEGYIGVTIDFDRRSKDHFTALKRGQHKNVILQEAYKSTFVITKILEAPEEYSYDIESKLRPMPMMGLNIVAGGIKTSVTMGEVQRQMVKEGTHHWLKQNRKGKYGNECTSEFHNAAVLDGTHPWIKKNRKGKYGNEFTSDTAREMALKRSALGTLPNQISSKNGTHHWFDRKHSDAVSERNKINFSRTTSVTDKFGRTIRIPVVDFEAQKIGPRSSWEYVGSASNEAKERRNTKCQ